MTAPRLVCLIGSESTGKTTLAQGLAEHFHGLWVPEYLRTFCAQHSRTPHREEQAEIIRTQVAHENLALAMAQQQGLAWVFCDTAPLLTAIYSDYVFGDASLYIQAQPLHARYALTLHLCPDIPWVPDGHQRDGAHVQPVVDALITRQLGMLCAPCAKVRGLDACRLEAAIQAIRAMA